MAAVATTSTQSDRLRRTLEGVRALPAQQQPDWVGDGASAVRTHLGLMDPPVDPAEIQQLHELLARAANGRLQVIQAGDCAEDPAECDAFHVARKIAVLDLLASTMALNTRSDVIRVGRIAGQFAKPRSRPTELVNGVELPVYRGHLVNGPQPTAEERRANPERMLRAAAAARHAHAQLRERSVARDVDRVWTSHEALVLDYETPLVRGYDDQLYLLSTHWPWIGERTRQLDGAHVALLSVVANPVACKIGPTTTHADLLKLCATLDPERRPGRLALIARMGVEQTRNVLPDFVAAVREAGHPVLWMCDPMHANTIRAANGRKTRLIPSLVAETRAFRMAVADAGGVAAGLHLETTPDAVLECVPHLDTDFGGARFESLCDPRLNPEQGVTVVNAWEDRT